MTTRKMHRFAGLACTLLLLAASPPAFAQTWQCWSGDSAALNFGEISANAPTLTQGSINLTCQASAPSYLRWCMYIPQGTPTGGIAPRYLSNGSSQMAYDLYSDPARTLIIGPPPTGGGFPPATGTIQFGAAWTPISISVPIYGRLPGGQNLTSGFYSTGWAGSPQFYLGGSTSGPPSSCTTPSHNFSLGVSATVAYGCRLSVVTDHDFGTVSNLSTSRNGTSIIVLRCPTWNNWTVGLNNGMHASGTTRRMRSPGGQYITYELYKDIGRSQRWGNAGTELVGDTGSGESNPVTLIVYGRVPAQGVAGGVYSDTVTVTLTY